MNLSGGWRALGVFDLDQCDIDSVLDAAETLVVNQSSGAKTGKLRITDDMQPHKPVLMYWDQTNGWKEARHAHP